MTPPATPHVAQLARIRQAHQAFAESRVRIYVPQQRLMTALFAFAESDASATLVVYGEAGSGKSALLANWARAYRELQPQAHLIEHYIGADAIGSDHVDALRHVVSEIADCLGVMDAVPTTAESLEDELPFWLARTDRPTVIILDALDELRTESQSLAWLPAFLPAHVRVVVSTRSADIVEILEGRGATSVNVPPLDRDDRLAILREHVSHRSSDLADAALLSLAEPGASANALFLCTSAQELMREPADTSFIDHYLGARDLPELFERVFQRLEDGPHGAAVGDVVRLLASSRRGLTHAELAGLVHVDADAAGELVSTLEYHTIRRGQLIAFSHDQFRAAAVRTYLADEEAARRYHRRLAEYFRAVDDPVRRADEEPWQWREAREPGELEACLLVPETIVVLSTDRTQHDLVQYWRALDGVAEASASFERVSGTWRSRQDVSEDLLAQVHDMAGDLLTKQGALDAARGHYLTALGLRTSEDDATARGISLQRLGMLDFFRGHYDDAERQLREARHELESSGGASQLLFDVRGDLAAVLAKTEKDDEAVALFEELIEDARGRGDAVSEAEYRNNLGTIHAAHAKYDDAVRQFETALDLNMRRHGRSHPNVARNLFNLAVTERKRGALDEAERRGREALALFKELLGDAHPSTVNAIAFLGNVLRLSGRYHEGLDLLERALEVTLATLGQKSVKAAALYGNIAGIRHRGPDPHTADPAYRACIRIRSELLGDDHPETQDIRRRYEEFQRSGTRDL
jgi:tetratricopeptide (TPR) repeat protein